jgi:putative copper resistance protein D
MLAFTIVRAAHFLALMILFGAEFLAALFAARLGAAAAAPLSKRFILAASATALVTMLLWYALTAVQISGSWNNAVDPQIWSTLAAQTSFGPVFLVRLGLCALLVLASLLPRFRVLRVALSGAALGAIALTSHAAASGESFFLARAGNDAVHLLAAGFWLGSLALLVPFAMANRKAPRAMMPALRLFSLAGTIAVALIIVAGTINAIMILHAGPSHWARGYMLLLAVKLVLAGLMVALALANRFGLLADLAKDKPEASDTLISSVVTEFATGTLIVAIVGLLGIMAPLT